MVSKRRWNVSQREQWHHVQAFSIKNVQRCDVKAALLLYEARQTEAGPGLEAAVAVAACVDAVGREGAL
ncbi:hypothetical protein INR49_012286 [Caranx melampygus]|nr:hypothetical protein INR49_012286 [Caranx melampygus]